MTDLLFEEHLPEALTQAENLPSLPTVAMEVLRLTQDEDSTIDDLAESISRDPALAAKLLKLSNSSLFSMGQDIATLQRATMVLGMKTVKLMSLSFSLVSSLPQKGEEAGFSMEQYWRRSVLGAVASRSFAKLLGSRECDEAFLCGLLGQLGKLVLARCIPEDYEGVVQAGNGWPSLTLEEDSLGFNSADLCASLLKSWELPEIIYMAVGYMGRPDELPADAGDDTRALVHLLHASSLVAAILGDEDKGTPMRELHEVCAQRWNLGENELNGFLTGLEGGIRETAEMLNVKMPSELSHDDLIEQARLQMVNISLGTAMDLNRAEQRTAQLESENQDLSRKATTDKLTGLPNRAAFDAFLDNQVHQRVRDKLPRALGLIMIDIDHFKSFNDTHGHQVGDDVLRMVGKALASSTRKGDLAARYGGEEFAVISPQTTPFGVKSAAERLRQAIEAEVLDTGSERLSVTASFGGACIAAFDKPADAKALIKLADTYLYRAKENGRNRTETYPKIQFPRTLIL